MAQTTFTLRLSGGSTTMTMAVDYTETYNAVANASTVQLNSVTFSGGYGSYNGMVTGKITINGTQVADLNYMRVRSGTAAAISASAAVVSHNSDGTGSFTLGLSPYSGYSGFFIKVTETNGVFYPTAAEQAVSLTAQPRASTIATSKASCNTLDTYTLTMNRKADSYWHKATFSIDGTTVQTSEPFETILSFPAPRDWFNSYPSSTVLSVAVSVQTYADESCTVPVGDAQTTAFTLYADAGMKPELAEGWATASPYNTGTAAAGLDEYVQGISKVQVTLDASKITYLNGAYLMGYEVKMGSSADHAKPFITDIISGTSAAVVCTVTDSRGRQSSTTLTIEAEPYSPPTIGEVEVFRCTAEGSQSPDGAFYSVKATVYYSEVKDQNSVTLSSQRAIGSGAFTTDGTLTSGEAAIFSGVNVDTTYKIRIHAEDTFGKTADFVVTLPSRAWAMKFMADGKGVAFGKSAEYANSLELPEGWVFRIAGKSLFDLIYPIGAIYMSVNSADPSTLFGGTWERLKDRFLLAAGDTYAADSTGGEATHTLTEDEMPQHNHSSNGSGASGSIVWNDGSEGPYDGFAFTNWARASSRTDLQIAVASNGNNQPHNNMPPYIAVYIWKRTA